jgi:hypothetical protein
MRIEIFYGPCSSIKINMLSVSFACSIQRMGKKDLDATLAEKIRVLTEIAVGLAQDGGRDEAFKLLQATAWAIP